MAKKEETEQLTPEQEKMKALQAAMAKIEKDFGKGSIMKLGDEKIENVEVIPTGSIGLNAALGVGGYPKGRIIEISARNHRVRPHWPSMPLPKHRRWEALPHSSMQSMPSTASTLKIWAST